MMLDLLPREILFEILSRLPVKFLRRVKCVCKALLCLISDPIFTNMLASRGPKFLILSSSGLQSLDCSKASFTVQGALTNPDFHLPRDEIINISSIEIEGSCNGLACVALKINDNKENYRKLFLWNPSTGIYKKLPDLVLNLTGDVRMWGFGYDSSINDYKVVCATIASSGRHCRDPDSDFRYRILATKTNSWRELAYVGCVPQCRNARCSSYDLPQGTLLNGTLHWLIDCYQRWPGISTFDLTEEQFSELPMPNDETLLHFWTLSVLDGCICLVSSSHRDRCVELWTMKEYGVESSWQKLFKLAENFGEINYRYSLRPLCFTTKLRADQDDEVVLLNNKDELIRFKPKDRSTLERLNICGYRIAQAIPYEESLASPNI
ncbi:hypothetical protein AB3S75_036722 [Citrus x aurantiifolia]